MIAFLFVALAHAAVTVKLSSGCQSLLAGRLEPFTTMVNRTLIGSGDVPALTASELGTLAKYSPVRREFANYEASSHDAVFLFLPPGIDHVLRTGAAVYADVPSTYLMVSSDFLWLGMGRTRSSDRKPVHLAVFTSGMTETIWAHEKIHLDDLEGLHAYAQSRLPSDEHQLMVRADVYKILTELRAYRMTIRIRREIGQWQTDVDSLVEELAPIFPNLTAYESWIIGSAFGLESTSRSGLEKFLTSDKPLPPLAMVLRALEGHAVAVLHRPR